MRISYNVHIPVHFCTEILVRDREHAFWKMLTKAISHKGGMVVRILHQRIGWCELLYFPLFLASPVLVIKKPKLNQTKIKLKQEIKIKTSKKNKTKRYGLASL